ncbi:sigma-70 family RNA polymerase sigma factor [Exilibacterium tricleocarpae]|uniref:RNA polymerase sigma factor n=1 Tax=Exilibacterium tricleocarpae TaxID=2591008 RepID=A0A545SSN6_9GAMM|nr:sigma-70 family RNA polymerase sigma factor [Exilibacterium tricleocarpae]TQV67990.1 sigma-70 family RNA polymerase sigma factor [Exilibacterium tricleocarpae]
MNDFIHTLIDSIDADDAPYDELTLADLDGDSAGSRDEVTELRPPAKPPPASDIEAGDRTEAPLLLYLREISRYPLLSSAEEAALLQRLSSDVEALTQLLPGDPSPADHAGLLRAATEQLRNPDSGLNRAGRRRLRHLQRRVEATREQVVNANLRLAVHISKRYWSPLYSMTDLIQEGNLGLLRALEKFDITKGYRFSTYAYWWIQQRVFRYVSDRWRIIRLPSNIADELRIWKRLAAKQAAAPDTPLPPAEQTKFDKLDRKYRANELLSAEHTLSLDRPMAEEGSPTLGQSIAGGQASIETQTGRAAVATLIHRHIARLSRREQTVIRMRYGIQMPDSYTCREVAEQVGVSVERVRQIEHEALAKLRDCATALVKDNAPR